MISTIFGFKKKQTQMYLEDGTRIPVTHVEAGPCFVTQITDRNDWKQVQIGFGLTKKNTKAIEGHLKKAGLTQKLRFLKSIRIGNSDTDMTVGQQVSVHDVLNVNDNVMVSGVSKGKGFAGVVKRHNFRGGPRTHGQSDRERAPGSIGQTTTPGRVYRGKRMAGRMGGETISVKGLKVIGVDSASNIVIIKGVIPGPVGAVVEISKI